MSMSLARTTQLLNILLVFTTIINLLLLLSGIGLWVIKYDLFILSVVLTSIGVLGIVVVSACWIARPRILVRIRSRRSMKRRMQPDIIDPTCAESLMKNIRGIPFLIQAIQYSMEATHYRDMMTELGEGMVRTSVIHTAPACTSVLDSESEDEQELTAKATPRNSGAEEQWLPIGERWRNEQLRLSLERPPHPTTLFVFPFRESTPRSEQSLNSSTTDIQSMIVPERGNSVATIEKEVSTPDHKKRVVRCIGMSAAFLTQIGSGIGSIECPPSDA